MTAAQEELHRTADKGRMLAPMKLAHSEDEPPGTRERRSSPAPLTAAGSPARLEKGPPDNELAPDRPSADDSGEYAVVLDVMRALADQEFDRGERISAKARHAFALVAVLLAAVQTAALGSLKATGVTPGEQRTILYLAAVAVALAAITGVFALAADRLQSFRNLSSQNVLDSAGDSLESGQPVARDLAQLFATAVDQRRAAVARRRRWLVMAQLHSMLTILALGAELLYTLHTRLP